MTAEFTLAVHALVYLRHKMCVVSSTELADNICTNPARVRRVMNKLCKAGFVHSGRGSKSGYQLTADAETLSLDTVLLSLGENVLSMTWRSGDIDKECLISSGMGGIMEGIYGNLNKCCMDELKNITIEKINDKIFHPEGGKHNGKI